MTTDATLPAAVPLRLPPRSAYATPSSKSSKSTQRLKSSLTYYPIRPFAPLHVCMEDLTADIFHACWKAGTHSVRLAVKSRGRSPFEIGMRTAQRKPETDGLARSPFHLSGTKKNGSELVALTR